MKLSVLGNLPVALTVLVEGKAVVSKKVEFSDISTSELITARSSAQAGEYLQIHEYCAKAKLLDDQGNKHEIPYDVSVIVTGKQIGRAHV